MAMASTGISCYPLLQILLLIVLFVSLGPSFALVLRGDSGESCASDFCLAADYNKMEPPPGKNYTLPLFVVKSFFMVQKSLMFSFSSGAHEALPLLVRDRRPGRVRGRLHRQPVRLPHHGMDGREDQVQGERNRVWKTCYVFMTGLSRRVARGRGVTSCRWGSTWTPTF